MGRPHHGLLVFGQLVDGAAHLPGLPGPLERGGQRRDLGLLVSCHQAVTSFAPVDINRDPAGDGIEPGTGVPGGVKPLGGTPRL